jgi:hypothetical protein
MTAESTALVVATVFLGIIALGQLYFLRSAVLTYKRLRQSIQNLEGRLVPLIEDMHTVTVDAHHELQKIDETVSRSKDLTEKMEAAAGVAKVAAATPVIKAATIAAGVRGTVEALEDAPQRRTKKGRRKV